MHWIECATCGTWLPMGPSDEERVAIEVRAAAIAAHRTGDMGMAEAFGWEGWLAPRRGDGSGSGSFCGTPVTSPASSTTTTGARRDPA